MLSSLSLALDGFQSPDWPSMHLALSGHVIAVVPPDTILVPSTVLSNASNAATVLDPTLRRCSVLDSTLTR